MGARPVPETWEWYWLKDKVWFEATGHEDKFGEPRFLCVGCVEQRLGRGLVSTDFEPTPWWNATPRLQDRSTRIAP